MFSSLSTPAVRATIAVVFLAGCVMPASAKMTVIRELGTAPLLGPSSSTDQMRERVEKNQTYLRDAALKSGLTAAQFQRLNEAIATAHVQWVTVPRYLTVMTWRSGENVYVIRNVKIPPGVGGWEVDLAEKKTTLAVYLPAKCGNLSYVRRARQDVAVAPHPRKPAAVAAVVPAAPATAVPVPPVPNAVAAPAAAPAPNAAAAAAPVAATAAAAALAGASYSPIGAIAAAAGALAGGIASIGSGGGTNHSPACF